ncbi:FAD-dependent oxidoreductase [Candidatus Saccharibacteria bacterium]|nr:MAG: FAD-dependent oxidoreductase [Candidatus Saccharibacteria bacterium]
MNVRFISKQVIAPDVCEFCFRPNTEVEYTPGQYARFTFPFHIDDPRGKQHRTFSLISHPSDPDIRFITRLNPPLSIYKTHLFALKSGDTMRIDEPHGDAVLPRLATTPIIFVAQGIALASYLSMLDECARSDLAHPISLLWVRRGEDDRLENLIPGEVPHLTRIDLHYPTRLRVDDVLPNTQSTSLIYLSGSQKFVESLGADLETAGIPRERLIYDYYSGYTDL